MTQNEFTDLLKQIGLSFPEFLKWNAEVEDPLATSKCWYEIVFEHAEKRDCDQVLEQMIRGDLKRPYQWSDLPSFFNQHVGRIKAARLERQEQSRQTKHWEVAMRIVSQGSMAKAYRKACQIIREAKEQGCTHQEAVDYMKGPKRKEWANLL